jgi:hypothetical protein
MKRIYKKASLLSIGLLFISGVALPVALVRAEENEIERTNNFSEQSSKNVEIRSKLCERYTSGRFSSNLNEKEDKVQNEFGSRGTELNTKRSENDLNLEELRANADAKRQEHYTKLLENASSDNQKTAVVTFQAEVEFAVADRRSTIDAARGAYRNGVDAAIASQKSSYQSAIADLKTATDTAIAKAKVSCEEGMSSSEVSATLKAELKAAKETFIQATKNVETLREQLNALRETRKSAYETAKTVFSERMDLAREALKIALESTESSGVNEN